MSQPLSPLLSFCGSQERLLLPRTDLDMSHQQAAVLRERSQLREEQVERDRFNNTTQFMSLGARAKTILACLGEARRYQSKQSAAFAAAVAVAQQMGLESSFVSDSDSLPTSPLTQPKPAEIMSDNERHAKSHPRVKPLRNLDLTEPTQYRAVYQDILLLTSKPYVNRTQLPNGEDPYSYTMKLLHAERPWA